MSDPDKLQIEAVTITFSFFQTHLNSGHVIDLVFCRFLEGGGTLWEMHYISSQKPSLPKLYNSPVYANVH